MDKSYEVGVPARDVFVRQTKGPWVKFAFEFQSHGELTDSVCQQKVFSMSKLAEQDCVPCKGGVPPLQGDQLSQHLAELADGWKVISEHHLEKEYKLKDFKEALDFTNQVGELAERVNHHPDIYLAWGKVKLTLWTHKIDGLTESDFVFAAKVDEIRK